MQEQSELFHLPRSHRLLMLPSLPPDRVNRFAGTCPGCDWESSRCRCVDDVAVAFRQHVEG